MRINKVLKLMFLSTLFFITVVVIFVFKECYSTRHYNCFKQTNKAKNISISQKRTDFLISLIKPGAELIMHTPYYGVYNKTIGNTNYTIIVKE